MDIKGWNVAGWWFFSLFRKLNSLSLVWCRFLIAFLVALAINQYAYGQNVPDAGALEREIETQEEKDLPELSPPEKVILPPKDITGAKMPITTFVFQGNVLLSDAFLNQVVKDWVGKRVTLDELKYLTDLVAAEYRKQGYLARVLVPPQNVDDGSVNIVVIEAKFGAVKIDGDEATISEQMLAPDFVKRTVYFQQRSGRPLKLKKIERATLILNDLPGVEAKTVLKPSATPEHTDVAIKLEKTPKYKGSVGIDNFGVRSTGEARLTPSLKIENPLRIGDRVRLNGLYTEGNQYGRLAYSLPVGVSGLRVGANVSYLQYELGDEFESLDANGDATTVGLEASYPLIRQLAKNVSLNLSLVQRDYNNEQLGIEVSDKKVNALTFSVSGDFNDSRFGGGVNLYSAGVVVGDLDLSGNIDNQAQDLAGPQTQGDFGKITWSAARLQHFRGDTNFWFSLSGQFATKNMDSSESISMGGPSAVRAYPALEGTGDTGMVYTMEARHTYAENIVLSVFYDLGRVHQRATQIQNKQTHTFHGAGLSLDWKQSGQFMAKFVIARRFGANPLRNDATGNDSNGDRELWPIWVNVTRIF